MASDCIALSREAGRTNFILASPSAKSPWNAAWAEQPFRLAGCMTYEKLEERLQVHGNKPLPDIPKFVGLDQPLVFTEGAGHG